MTIKRTQRRRHYAFGKWAELLSCWHLRLRGYQIRAVRYKTPVGEIDIVASRGEVTALIEVKARRRFDQAALALAPKQQRRICRAAAVLQARQPELMRTSLRYDLMLVQPWAWPRHIENAWEGL
jgi:putative endonuclease